MSSSKVSFGQKVSVSMDRKRITEDLLNLKGFFRVEHWRDGKCIGVHEMPNGITIEGKNHVLDVAFHAQTAAATWYLGAIDLTGYTSLTENDTYDDINQAGNGWDEFEDYDFAAVGTDRVIWVEASASGKSITNSATPGVFDITGAGTVKGVFLVAEPVGAAADPDLQGDHAAGGILWSTALFSTGDVAVINGDQLKVTYTISS